MCSPKCNYSILDLRKKREAAIINDANMKQFYNYVNSKLHTPHSIANLKDSEGSIVNDPFTKATLLNNMFVSAFTTDNKFFATSKYPTPDCHLSIQFNLLLYQSWNNVQFKKILKL